MTCRKLRPSVFPLFIAVVVVAMLVSGCGRQAASARKSQNGPMTKAAFVAEVKSAGLSTYASRLESLVRPSIAVRSSQGGGQKSGESRIGGAPDLPEGVAWPEWKGTPLSFIAQLRLSDLAKYDPENALPHVGMLYLFYDSKQEAWGTEPSDKGCAKVIYYPGDTSKLSPTPFPARLAAEWRYLACTLAFAREDSIPPPECLDVQELNMNKTEFSAYQSIYEKSLDRESAEPHRVLGYPFTIQNEMQTDCQLVTHGLPCGDASGYNDPRAKQLAGGAKQWRLLMEVISDENPGMMWGDSGSLYFWITESDLRARRFENVWMISQCY